MADWCGHNAFWSVLHVLPAYCCRIVRFLDAGDHVVMVSGLQAPRFGLVSCFAKPSSSPATQLT